MLIQIKKVSILARKSKLKAEQDKITKLQAFDSNYIRGKNHFVDDGTKNYLVFQQMYKYFTNIGNTDYISAQKSIGFSNESIKLSSTSDNSLVPSLSSISPKTRGKLVGRCLKQDKVTFIHKKLNIYIVYKIVLWNYTDSNEPTLENSLFDAVKLVKMILDMELDLI